MRSLHGNDITNAKYDMHSFCTNLKNPKAHEFLDHKISLRISTRIMILEERTNVGNLVTKIQATYILYLHSNLELFYWDQSVFSVKSIFLE